MGKDNVFDKIAGELCRRVGLEFPPPAGTKYEVGDATWTESEEDDFRKWLTAYLKTVRPYKSMVKARLKKEIDWFIFQYSWKYKKNGDEVA